jgi:hypothetical protein
MKKGKILLSAVAVLVAASGILAFKVRGTQSLFCSHPIDGQCKVVVTGIKTTSPLSPHVDRNCTSSSTTTTCPLIPVTNGS